MISDRMKRAVSAGVFGLGILGGLRGCYLYARGMFTAGLNDCTAELLALTFAFATPLPVCVVGLWKRLVPGMWLIFAGCFLPYGMLAERAYMIHVRHFLDQTTVMQTIGSSLPYSLILVALGGFAVITHLSKWPEVLHRSKDH
jgi:hypothetical protein